MATYEFNTPTNMISVEQGTDGKVFIELTIDIDFEDLKSNGRKKYYDHLFDAFELAVREATLIDGKN